MKKIIILMLFLILPLANSITSEQKSILEEAIDSANTKYDFEKLMDLLNKQKVDLSDETEIISDINSLSRKFNVDLGNYPDIKGIKEKKEKINWTVIAAVSLFIIALIFEVYMAKNKKKNTQQLEDYIKDAIKKGYTKKQIKDILLKNNWDESTVDSVLRNI